MRLAGSRAEGHRPVRWWRVLFESAPIILELVLLFRFVLTEHRGPRELPSRPRARGCSARQPVFDERAALLDLSVALDGASKAGDRELASTILRLRERRVPARAWRAAGRLARRTSRRSRSSRSRRPRAPSSPSPGCATTTETSARRARASTGSPRRPPTSVRPGSRAGASSFAPRKCGWTLPARSLPRAEVMDRDLESALALLERIAALDADVPGAQREAEVELR